MSEKILTICLNCGSKYQLKRTDEDEGVDLIIFNFCPKCEDDADENITETRYKETI